MLNLKKLLPHIPTIIACALIVAMGIIWTVWSSPGITTIGEDISATNITATNDLTVSGSASLATTTADNLTVSGSTGLATTTATGLTVSGDFSATGTISEGGTLLSSKYIPAPGNATTGDVLYYNGTDWVRLGTGESGQFLQSQGPGSTPKWADAGGVVQVQEVYATSSVSTVSTNYVDMPDMSIETETGNNYLLVLFTGRFVNPNYKGGDYRLLIDGDEKLVSTVGRGNEVYSRQNDTMSLHHIEKVSAGTHIIKVQFKAHNSSHGFENVYDRKLSIIELK